MTEGAGCQIFLYNSLTFLCFRPLSRVMEEKPVIQEAATEPESSGTGSFFACIFTGIVPHCELSWAAASPFAPRPSSLPAKCLMEKLSGERAIVRDASRAREKRKRAKVVISAEGGLTGQREGGVESSWLCPPQLWVGGRAC